MWCAGGGRRSCDEFEPLLKNRITSLPLSSSYKAFEALVQDRLNLYSETDFLFWLF